MKINSFGTDTLVELNRWIEEHPDIRIINIETVLTDIRPVWRKSYYVWYEEIEQIETALEKFKELPHFGADYSIIPKLYNAGGKWRVSLIHSSGRFSGRIWIGFDGVTAEEAIDKAYEWYNEFRKNGKGYESKN